ASSTRRRLTGLAVRSMYSLHLCQPVAAVFHCARCLPRNSVALIGCASTETSPGRLRRGSYACGSRRLELAIRDWARRDRKDAKRLRRVDNRRMDYLRSLFGAFCPDADEVEIRSLVTFSIFVGRHFIAADHGARSRDDVVTLALGRLVA